MDHSFPRFAAQPTSNKRRVAMPDQTPPNVCLLSNGRYSVVLTGAGSGYSTHNGLDVTRWREDATCDCWGQHCYIRDLDGGRAWSAGRQPLRDPARGRRESPRGPGRAGLSGVTGAERKKR